MFGHIELAVHSRPELFDKTRTPALLSVVIVMSSLYQVNHFWKTGNILLSASMYSPNTKKGIAADRLDGLLLHDLRIS